MDQTKWNFNFDTTLLKYKPTKEYKREQIYAYVVRKWYDDTPFMLNQVVCVRLAHIEGEETVPAQYTKQEHGADTQAFSPAVLARGSISYGGPACTEKIYYGGGLVSGILGEAGTVSQFRPRWFYLE